MAKSRILFLADYCLTPFERINAGGILCERDKIIATGGATAFSLDEEGLEVIDLAGCYAMPGLIDSHIHGIGPYESAAAPGNPDILENMGKLLSAHGVTTFFPTVVSRPRDSMISIVDSLARQIDAGISSADAPGMHIEGPFINREKRGSQDENAICDKIDLGYAREIFEAGNGRIKIMSFAPELENSSSLVELMLEYGVIPSMGHSMADEKDTLRAIDAGACRCTYIFNGMPTLHHREASLTTVALTDDRVSVEMICDGAHIHPRIVDLTSRCKPMNKIIGISNSVASADDAIYKGDVMPVSEKGDIVKTNDGVITGATMTLENSWLHLINYTKLERSLAAACFTYNPAFDLGLITRGELKPGRRADITFFDSVTNKVRMTVLKGRVIYKAES